MMQRLFAATVVLTAAIAAQGQTRIAVLGDTVHPASLASLSKLLGNDYVVRTADDAETKSVLLGFRDAGRRNYDDLVPTVKAQIRRLGSKKVYVLLTPSNLPTCQTYLYPLLRQAAREAGATVIDLTSASTDAEIGAGIYESIVDQRMTKKDWKVLFLDSYESEEGSRNAAIDGDPDTIWHTGYSNGTPRPPHEIQIDLGRRLEIGAFRHLPRQDGGVNGRIKAYELYASDDPKAWGSPIAKGNFPNTAEPTTVRLKSPVAARYIRLVALSEQNNGPWTSLAELDILPPLPKD